MVEKIKSKEKTKSSSGSSSLNSLDLGSEIRDPTEQLQSRQDMDDAAWILFNMSQQQHDDFDFLGKKKIRDDPFIGFPKKQRSIPQNPKWVSPPMECAQGISNSRVLSNMANDPFTGFPKKKCSFPQNAEWVSPMDDDVARVLCDMEKKTNGPFSQNPKSEKKTNVPFSQNSTLVKKTNVSFSQNPNLVFPHCNPPKMRLKITYSGVKRCLEDQGQCGDPHICKKQRTTEKPEMPQRIKDAILKMGGSEARFLVQKTLQCSDTNHQQARLQIPVKQVDSEFLSKEEQGVLEQNNQGIPVMLIQPSNNISTHFLKRRRMGKVGVYHITNKWNAMLDDQANGLTTGAIIQIWSFRTHTHLGFAMVTL